MRPAVLIVAWPAGYSLPQQTSILNYLRASPITGYKTSDPGGPCVPRTGCRIRPAMAARGSAEFLTVCNSAPGRPPTLSFPARSGPRRRIRYGVPGIELLKGVPHYAGAAAVPSRQTTSSIGQLAVSGELPGFPRCVNVLWNLPLLSSRPAVAEELRNWGNASIRFRTYPFFGRS